MIVLSEPQRAQFHDQEEHAAVRDGPCQGRRSGEADDATRAAQPEDRRSLNVPAQLEPLHQERIEARRRNAGCGDDHDGVDVRWLEVSLRQAIPGDTFGERNSVFEVERIPLDPTTGFAVPVDLNAGMSGLDLCVLEHWQKPVRFAVAAKDTGRFGPSIELTERM